MASAAARQPRTGARCPDPLLGVFSVPGRCLRPPYRGVHRFGLEIHTPVRGIAPCLESGRVAAVPTPLHGTPTPVKLHRVAPGPTPLHGTSNPTENTPCRSRPNPSTRDPYPIENTPCRYRPNCSTRDPYPYENYILLCCLLFVVCCCNDVHSYPPFLEPTPRRGLRAKALAPYKWPWRRSGQLAGAGWPACQPAAKM